MNVTKERINEIAIEMEVSGISPGYVNKVRSYAYVMPSVAEFMEEWSKHDDDNLKEYVFNAIKYMMGDEDSGILV